MLVEKSLYNVEKHLKRLKALKKERVLGRLFASPSHITFTRPKLLLYSYRITVGNVL